MASVNCSYSPFIFRLCLLTTTLLTCTFGVSQDGDGRKSEKFVVIDPEGKKGFMFGANIGYYLANDEPAIFYNGLNKGEGFLDIRDYLNRPTIKPDVLLALGGNTANFDLTESGFDIHYENVINFGGHLRYQFNWTNALVADVNFSSMKIEDSFALSYRNDNGTSELINQHFPIFGKEDRLFASLGYQVNLSPPGMAGLNFEFGPELVSVKVKSNTFRVGSRNYNILRAQTIGTGGSQILNSKIPTLSFIGAYTQFAANLEFDKYTIDLGWRTSFQKISLSDVIPAKRRMSHTPFIRLVYRVTIKGF